MKRSSIVIILALAAVAGGASPARAAMAIVHTAAVARGPASVAFDPLTQLGFVGNVTDDRIAVFAGVAKVAEIAQPNLNPVGLAVDPAGGRLFASSFNGSVVNVFNVVDRKRVAQIATTGRPWGVSVDAATGTAYVAMFTSNELLAIARDNSVRRVALPGCGGAIGVAFSAPAARVLVTCIYSGTIHAVAASSLSVAGVVTIGLGAYTQGVAAHPTQPVAIVANTRSANADPNEGSITVLDVATMTPLSTAAIGGAPVGAAYSPLGTPYVTLSGTHKLAVLEPSGAIAETVALPIDASTPGEANNPQAVAVHPTSRYAIVGNFHAESVSFVTATHL